MHRTLGAMILGVLGFMAVHGQTQGAVSVCDLTDVNNVNDCYFYDSSKIGALKLEDYKVTNPAAIQFDPALRLKELAALGPSTAATLCQAQAQTPFIDPAPSITFSNAQAQIYWRGPVPTFGFPIEFMDVQFTDFKASNGYSSPSFGFRMNRQLNLDGSPISEYRIALQFGNPGLQNVAGLPGSIGFLIDPLSKNVTFLGTAPSSQMLSQAIYGVFVHAQSILNAAKFTVTNPAPEGQTLWTAPEIISLAGHAESLIVGGPEVVIPLGPPYRCGVFNSGYSADCAGRNEILAFIDMLLPWSGEYLGLRTTRSFNVLVRNLRAWAAANAPAIDPASPVPVNVHGLMIDVTTELLMLWPTLRDDPALSSADRRLIEDWLGRLVALPGDPDFFTFPNDLGEWGAAVAMADGIRRSDNEAFVVGIQRFYGALLQMRPDGSFPLSARLSACSAVYSDTDLLHLTTIAEMAATQGYDLYSLSVNGKSLDTAINFFLDAHENPALLAQYSKAGGGGCFEGSPGDPPDFDGLFGPGTSQRNLAWMEPYLARFPFSSTAARIRKILGSNVAALPFPLEVSRTGLNATCAFRKSYEFQPVNGAKVVIVSGDGQTVGVDQPDPAPLSVVVTDNSGKALAGMLVSFAVVQGSANLTSPAQVLTDATGAASATVAVAGGPVTVTAVALGASVSFSLTVSGLAIYPGRIVGIGASVPSISTISPGALFSIYGQDFAPAGASRRVNPDEIVSGVLPQTLLDVCVSVGGLRAPLLAVSPGQIDAVAPALTTGSKVDVIVTTGCGTPAAAQSSPQSVTVAAASPEFLYFAHNADGQNPVQAVNSVSGANVGSADLGAGFTPAYSGDLVTIFASGLGPTNPPVIPGAVAAGPAQTLDAVTVRLGSVILDAKDVLYAGTAPGQLISQLNIRIPPGIPVGRQPLQIRIGPLASPPGAFLTIGAP